jgi:hypothetical protein
VGNLLVTHGAPWIPGHCPTLYRTRRWYPPINGDACTKGSRNFLPFTR